MRKLTKIAIVITVAILFAIAGVGSYYVIDMFNGKLNQIISFQNKSVTKSQTELLSAINSQMEYHDFDYSWVNQVSPLVAHALGGIDEQNYTNSLEAFEYNYQQGYRVFEVDLELTAESLLVATHDQDIWRYQTDVSEDTAFTNDVFLNTKVLDKYTPLCIQDIIELMAAYPDVYIITDTKYSDKINVLLQFSQIVKYAQENHPETLNRIIPQIYNENMLPYLMEIYPFQSVIYTTYATDATPEEIRSFCEKTGIGFVVIPKGNITKESVKLMDEAGIFIGVHTLNDPEKAKLLLDNGVDMIYTDFLQPNDFISTASN